MNIAPNTDDMTVRFICHVGNEPFDPSELTLRDMNGVERTADWFDPGDAGEYYWRESPDADEAACWWRFDCHGCGTLHELKTGEEIRPATVGEAYRSDAAARRDGGIGAIEVRIDGEAVSCYVEP